MNQPARRYLPLLLAGPLLVPATMSLARQFQFPDFVTGFIGGAGIGLSILGLYLTRRASR